MSLKQIKKNTINSEKFSFGKEKGMLIERYFDISKNGVNQEEKVYLYLENFHFKIDNKITVSLIYLDTTKKASPKENMEFLNEIIFALNSPCGKYDNNQKIEIKPKDKDMELWKIRIELDKYDEVQFFATWK